MTYDLILRGGTIVNHAGTAVADVAVKDGRIAAVGDLRGAVAAEEFDARHLHVLPGCMDTQVHFREPGLTHKEDLATGTAAAALGGITAVFEMPNTKPSTTTPEAIAEKLNAAAGRAWVDHAFYLGGCAENADRLAEWERLPGVCGVKIFMGSSTGSLLVADDATLDRVVATIARRMAVHCEDEARLNERKALIPADADARWHPLWRDEQTALRATTRLIAAARKYKKRVHALHITTAEELDLLRQHKDLVTVEVLPQHLTLAAPECYERLGTYAQMNPPIRDERHRAALWAAIQDGTVDVLGSDHAPHTREEKDKGFPFSPSGMPGVQTILPLMLDHVHHRRLSIERVVDLLAHGPQRIFGLAGKGRLACGYDADFSIVDLKARHTITHAEQATRCGWTPFDGMTVTGWPVATIIRGRTVMRDGQLVGTAAGKPLRFVETGA
jgi:dihydroorotase